MKYIQQLKSNIHLVIAFSILILATIISTLTSKPAAQTESRPLEVDTIIPKGYVLVPLELQNVEAISSVIQSYGVIDLYKGNPEGQKAQKIATRIKLIRAPYNPNLFAALVKENLSEHIMRQTGAFFAVIQNKTEAEGLNEKTTLKSIRIEYQN